MSQPTVTFNPQGTRLLVRINGVFTDIFQLQGVTGPSAAPNMANTTTLSSPLGFEESQPLSKKWSPVTGTLQWNPADAVHRYLEDSNFASPQPLERFMEIASDANSETVIFSGYVTGFNRKLITGQTGMVDLTIQPSGPPQRYYGLSPA